MTVLVANPAGGAAHVAPPSRDTCHVGVPPDESTTQDGVTALPAVAAVVAGGPLTKVGRAMTVSVAALETTRAGPEAMVDVATTRTCGPSPASACVSDSAGPVSSTDGSTGNPSNAVWGVSRQGRASARLYATGSPVAMSGAALTPNGSGQPHNNLAPYLVVTFIIALQGIYPARS